MSVLFAVTYRDLATALVLYGSIASGMRFPNSPWGLSLDSEFDMACLEGWYDD